MQSTQIKERLASEARGLRLGTKVKLVVADRVPVYPRAMANFTGDVTELPTREAPRFGVRVEGARNAKLDLVTITIHPKKVHTDKQLDQLAQEYVEALIENAGAVGADAEEESTPVNGDNGPAETQPKPVRRRSARKATKTPRRRHKF